LVLGAADVDAYNHVHTCTVDRFNAVWGLCNDLDFFLY
jgi:hypothetical protein